MMKCILTRDKRLCEVKREWLLKENSLYTIKLNPFSMTEESLSRVFTPVSVSPRDYGFPHSRLSAENDATLRENMNPMDEASLSHVQELARSLHEKYQTATGDATYS